MMNKYQMALNTLFMMASEHLGFELNYEKNSLQELVDKAKPLPRIEPKDRFYLWACPNCKTDFIDNNKGKYCSECGQRFEGSEND